MRPRSPPVQYIWTSVPVKPRPRKVQGTQPWPGAGFATAGMPNDLIKVWRARVEEGSGAPGTILSLDRDGPLVACGRDALRLLDVQPPGKRRMAASEAARGAGWSVGTVLG